MRPDHSWAVTSKGELRAASLIVQINLEIRRRAEAGYRQRFTIPTLGMIGLSEELPTGIADRKKHRRTERADALKQSLGDSPAEFEKLVATLLTTMGFEDVDLTPIGSDGGIDVRGTLVVGDTIRIRMAVQAKRWKANVGAPVVQQLRGSLSVHEQGLIITTSGFTRTARQEASRRDASPVALMDGKQLARLLAEYEIGVRR